MAIYLGFHQKIKGLMMLIPFWSNDLSLLAPSTTALGSMTISSNCLTDWLWNTLKDKTPGISVKLSLDWPTWVWNTQHKWWWLHFMGKDSRQHKKESEPSTHIHLFAFCEPWTHCELLCHGHLLFLCNGVIPFNKLIYILQPVAVFF